MLRLGYKASAEQFGPRELLDFGVAAEQHGFDSVVISDHFQPWRHTDGHAPFSFAWLAALGERTEKVLLGTSVVTPTFRYHPAIVAQAMGTLGVLNPGRVMLGVGTGESLNEVPVLDIEWPEFKERFGRLKEAVELMQRLWREDFVTFQGEYYRTRGATVYDKPKDPPLLYVAAAGEVAARYAGRVADGFICTSGKGMELYSDKLLPAVREGAEKAGRDYDKIEKMIEMKVSFAEDRHQAMEDTKIWSALALSGEQKTGVEDPREMEKLAKGVEDVAHRRWLVSDDVDEHLEQLRPYIELGFTHLVFHAPGDDQLSFIEHYGHAILPRLRERWG
jgi:coenzyme F420-dependent glucose-6-phosphate dehydrogenase